MAARSPDSAKRPNAFWMRMRKCSCLCLSGSLFQSLHMVHFWLCCTISLTSIFYGAQQKVGLLLNWSRLLEWNPSEHLKGQDLERGNVQRSVLDIYLYRQAHPVLFHNVEPKFVQGVPVWESYDCASWFLFNGTVWLMEFDTAEASISDSIWL